MLSPRKTGEYLSQPNLQVQSIPSGATSQPSPVRAKSARSGNDHFRVESNEKEELAWVNHALAHLWPELDRVASIMVTHRVLPAVKVKLPEKIRDVKCHHFTLGKRPPEFKHIKVSSLPRGMCRFQCEVEYYSDMEVKMSVDAGRAGTVYCGIENFKITGKLVLTLSPYDHHAQGQGYANINFLDMPEIDFSFSGKTALLNQLGIKKIVISSLRGALNKACVMPRMLTINLNLKTFELYSIRLESAVPVGVLNVKLLRCSVGAPIESRKFSLNRIKRRLNDAFEAVDNRIAYLIRKDVSEYLVFKVGSSTWQPKAKESDVSYDFEVVDLHQRLIVELWDKDVVGSDDLLGSIVPCTMDSTDGISGTVIPIRSERGEEVGRIELDISFNFVQPRMIGMKANVLMLHVKELRHRGSGWEGNAFVVEAKCGDEVQNTGKSTLSKPWYRDGRVEKAVAQVRENFERAKLDPVLIEEALKLDRDEEVVPVHARCVFCSIPTRFLTNGVVDISIHMKPVEQDKRGVLSVNVSRKGKNLVPVLAATSLRLDDIVKSLDFRWLGPMSLRTADGDEIVVEMSAILCGLFPRTKSNIFEDDEEETDAV